MCHKMAIDAVPKGGGLLDGFAFLCDPKRVTDSARAAQQWVEDAIAAVKAAPDNPYGEDDELICAEILRLIEEKKQ